MRRLRSLPRAQHDLPCYFRVSSTLAPRGRVCLFRVGGVAASQIICSPISSKGGWPLSADPPLRRSCGSASPYLSMSRAFA